MWRVGLEFWGEDLGLWVRGVRIWGCGTAACEEVRLQGGRGGYVAEGLEHLLHALLHLLELPLHPLCLLLQLVPVRVEGCEQLAFSDDPQPSTINPQHSTLNTQPSVGP